jgi:hypothetical protein
MSEETRQPGWRPPITPRPPDGKPLTDGELLALWLDSVPTVRINGYVTPENAPLTPDEAARLEDYLRRT